MSIDIPYNEIYKKQNKSLIPSSFKKAIISSVNTNNNSANIYFVENSQTIINNIPFATSVVVANVKQGQRCKVDFFDESNPRDWVISYTY